MLTIPQFTSNLLVQLNHATNRTFALPILISFDRALNSRCVWRLVEGGRRRDLTVKRSAR